MKQLEANFKTELQRIKSRRETQSELELLRERHFDPAVFASVAQSLLAEDAAIPRALVVNFVTEEPSFFGIALLAHLSTIKDQSVAQVWRLGRKHGAPWFPTISAALTAVFGHRSDTLITEDDMKRWRHAVDRWMSLDRYYPLALIEQYGLWHAYLPNRPLSRDELELRSLHGVLQNQPTDKSDIPAVIFEPRAGREAFGLPDSGVSAIYAHHKDVYTAYTGSVEELCAELTNARELFGRPIGLVQIAGHGHPTSMELGHDDFWQEAHLTTASQLPEGCIDANVAKDATIILRSCSTGAVMSDTRNLAQQVAKWAPGRTVIAPCTDTTPNALTYTLKYGKPHVRFIYTDGSNQDHTFVIKPRPRSFLRFVASLFVPEE